MYCKWMERNTRCAESNSSYLLSVVRNAVAVSTELRSFQLLQTTRAKIHKKYETIACLRRVDELIR